MNKQWQAASQVIEQIERAGLEAVFVGGAVRDHLLHRPCHDVDVATSALPEEVKRIFDKTVDVGIEHGTILVLDTGSPIEVTTYRTEGDYNDFRRPEQVQFVRNLQDDLKRRDFKINALAMRSNGEIVDLYNGQQDLQNHIIRAVGNANERFTEDALRMLRAARFSAQLGFTIEPATLQAMQQQSFLLQHIAVERIAQELEKMWCSDNPYKGMQVLVETAIASFLAGDFASTLPHWRPFKAHDARDGWAYFVLTNNDHHLIKSYKLSNHEKNYILAIEHAFKLIQSPVDNVALFYVETEHLQTASRMAQWLGIATVSLEELLSRKAAFPIQALGELMVSGHELIAWRAQRGGPWVKEALDAILQAVLQQQVKNDTETIKDWFLQR